MIYLALFILAIWCSRANQGAMWMTVVIGISWSAHYPLSLMTDRSAWFMIVFFVDMFIIYAAIAVWRQSSLPIIGLSFMLCVGHLIDWRYETDPVYYQIANYLEYLEIISCIIFSPVVLDFIKQRIKSCLSK